MIDFMLCPKCGGINNQSINYCRECSRNLHVGKWWKTLSLRLIVWVGLFELTLFLPYKGVLNLLGALGIMRTLTSSLLIDLTLLFLFLIAILYIIYRFWKVLLQATSRHDPKIIEAARRSTVIEGRLFNSLYDGYKHYFWESFIICVIRIAIVFILWVILYHSGIVSRPILIVVYASYTSFEIIYNYQVVLTIRKAIDNAYEAFIDAQNSN